VIRPPVVESVGENYVVIEPPAGMLKLINERVEQIKKLESKFVMLDYSSIFVLVCLHVKKIVENNNAPDIVTYHSTAVSIAAGIGLDKYKTLRSVFTDATDEEFVKIVTEFQFTYPRDVIDSVFNKIDELCFITKKKADDEKKD
jgi:hypothetical protein